MHSEKLPDKGAPKSGSDLSSNGSGLSAGSLVINIVGSLLILAIGIGGFIVYGKRPEVPTDDSAKDLAGAAVPVVTAEVRPWNAPFTIQVDGEAASYRVLTVGAEVAGRIVEKPETTRNGTYVTEGTRLFQIDPVNYQLELNRLQAKVDQAMADLAAVQVDVQNTTALMKLAEEDCRIQKNQLQRLQSLFERKATSEVELDTAVKAELNARNALQMQQNQLNALLQTRKTRAANVELAEAELERAKVDLARCQVVAPISGRIADDLVEAGDYVRPGDPLVHISDSSRMEIKCSLRGDQLAWIWQQREVRSNTETRRVHRLVLWPMEGILFECRRSLVKSCSNLKVSKRSGREFFRDTKGLAWIARPECFPVVCWWQNR